MKCTGVFRSIGGCRRRRAAKVPTGKTTPLNSHFKTVHLELVLWKKIVAEPCLHVGPRMGGSKGRSHQNVPNSEFETVPNQSEEEAVNTDSGGTELWPFFKFDQIRAAEKGGTYEFLRQCFHKGLPKSVAGSDTSVAPWHKTSKNT